MAKGFFLLFKYKGKEEVILSLPLFVRNKPVPFIYSL